MQTFKLLALILSALGIQFAQAQSKTLNVINDISTTGEKVKRLFENKNSNPKNTGSNSARREPPTKSGSPHPGDVASNAITINYDETGPFNCGAAIVKKGNASALMDAKGKIIVPFNKYKLVSTLEGTGAYNNTIYFSGLFEYDSMGYNKVMNAHGRPVSGKFTYSHMTKDGKYAVHYDDRDNKLAFIDTNGVALVLPRTFKKNGYGTVNSPENFSDNLGVARLDDGNMPGGFGYSYMNVRTQALFQHKYDIANDFSEGIACVGKRDEGGIIKYGFIDEKENLVIPYTYTNMPTNFKCGLSRITPKNASEFAVAYINKKGDIVIKCKYNFGEFTNGLAYTSGLMIDTAGKQYKSDEYFAKLGIRMRTTIEHVNVIEADQMGRIHDGKIRFQKTFRADAPEGENTAGYLDIKTGNIIGFNFSYKGDSQKALWFDPVSKLAYAERCIGKDNSGRGFWRKGYINEEGIFVIVRGEASTW